VPSLRASGARSKAILADVTSRVVCALPCR
jgi:hypothetical protein